MPDPRTEVQQILDQHGAVLKRHKNHEVWEFPDGRKFTRAKTPSDAHSDANNLAQLKRLLRPPERAPVTPPLKQNAAPAPKVGRKVEKVWITPDQAASWLELNISNRPINSRKIGEYVEDMKAGRWLYNYQPIIFDINNTLIDGQHRLKAVVSAKVSIQSDVVFDAPIEIKETIDIGMQRSAAQMAALRGMEYAAGVTSIARTVLIMEANDGAFARDIGGLSKPRVMQYVFEHTEELTEAARVAETCRKLYSTGTLGAAYFLFKRANPEKAVNFFELLSTGVGLAETSVVLKLRERLISNRASLVKMGTAPVLALTIKAFNFFCAGEEPKRLLWGSGGATEAFPRVIGG